MSRSKVNRRDFIETAATSAALTVAALSTATVAPAAEETNYAAAVTTTSAKLPQRTLGRTGASVPVIAFGCGSRFLMYRDEAEAVRVLNHVLDSGITYLDTAAGYGDGLSETRVGLVMKTRRRDAWLATKVPENARTRDAALRAAEQSLKRLQTDHVDLLHLHSLKTQEDLDRIEAPDGALKALYELREQKVARFIGMTSHTDGAVMARAIERNDLDCVQMAMNPARASKFEELALPAAKKKNLGVILMKVTAQEKLVGAGNGRADMGALLRYALSLPVSTAVIGMPRMTFIEQNIAVAREFRQMSDGEMNELRQRIAPVAQAKLENYFRRHRDEAFV